MPSQKKRAFIQAASRISPDWQAKVCFIANEMTFGIFKPRTSAPVEH
jgi:hypothetical protein